MDLPHDSTPVDTETCRAIVEGKAFGFRPADYCERYPKWPGMVGFEVEMFPVQQQSGRVLPLFGAGSSSELLLQNLGEGRRRWQPRYRDDDPQHGLLSLALDHEDQVTFEPGGQVEFSSKPYPCLSEAIVRVEKVQERLDGIFAQADTWLLQGGINPLQSTEDIGLQMTKARYQAMDRHFRAISPYGARMMRQTASIQVNLDFGGTEDELARRYLLANLLAPALTALFANSPFADGRDQQLASARAHAWQHLDPSRTGFPKLAAVRDHLDLAHCTDAYLDFLLDANVIYVEGLGYKCPKPALSFRQWLQQGFEGVKPTVGDFLTHMTLQFPEVRPKGFLEVRSIDGLARFWQVVPAAVLTALLYDEKARDEALDLLLPSLDHLPGLLTQALAGYQEPAIREQIAGLTPLVLAGFGRLPPCFQGEGTAAKLKAYWQHYVERGLTPADELRERFGRGVTWQALRSLEDEWQKLLT